MAAAALRAAACRAATQRCLPAARGTVALAACRLAAHSGGVRPAPTVVTGAAAMATRSELAARSLAAARPVTELFNELVARIDTAVAGMVAVNAGFSTVRRSPTAYEVHTGSGGKVFSFYLTDDTPRRLCFVSPKAGDMLFYTFDAGRRDWVHDGTKDRHLLVEMFSRDLVYLCKGYPTF